VLAGRMLDRMPHRGPDGRGVHTAGPLALGHLRLSIIDLATGAQPMSTPDGRFTIVFNGEIYNHRDLRRELEPEYPYRTSSDTESLLHGWRRWGPGMLDRLEGMFAFAIADRVEGTVFCARDRLGKKPFYYVDRPDVFIFASEIKAILEHPGIPREVDPEALELFLALGYVPAPWTMFRGIRKLPAGHWLRAGAKTEIREYWDVRPETVVPGEEAVRERVRAAVKKRLISDVPVGCYLSGGIDSTIVSGLASAEIRGMRTFSAGFSEGPSEKFNADLALARVAAKQFGTIHEEVLVDQAIDLPALVRQVAWALDEPLANAASIPTFLVARLARERGVPVLLSGDGADELFAGYDRYLSDALVSSYRRVPGWARAMASPLLRLNANLGKLDRKARLDPGPERYLTWHEAFPREMRARLIAHDLPGPDFVREVVRRVVDRPVTDCFQERLLYGDLKLWIAEESNMRMDKMSMLASVETRAPFLDHHLVEFAAGIPFAEKVRGRRYKALLRDAFADLLPAEIRTRSKWGFIPPASEWLRGRLNPLAKEMFSPEKLRWFRHGTVSELFDDHVAKRAYHLPRLWILLAFQLWQETYLS
ncbi:MAG: asparagine synthase (glutamine-hydrolyzing), partial [Candidatus Brocadiae bacterium]|nr:asparagine synthase (glutamine-hydrolyzing) [Candidatus Brocadiia bacterium]